MDIIDKNSVQDQKSKPTKPDNYLIWAILSTLFCCLPLGIVAIIKATQVDSYWAQDKYEDAYQSAADAKRWTHISVGLAAAGIAIYILIVILSVVLGLSLA